MDLRLSGALRSEIDDPVWSPLFYDGRGRFVIERHNDGANYCFADGHVKWVDQPPVGLTALPGD